MLYSCGDCAPCADARRQPTIYNKVRDGTRIPSLLTRRVAARCSFLESGEVHRIIETDATGLTPEAVDSAV